MEKFLEFLKKNVEWVVLTILLLVVAVVVLACLYGNCHKSSKALQHDYELVVSENESLIAENSTLYEEIGNLQAEDSLCHEANKSLAQACDQLRRKCDSLQTAKRTVRPTPVRRTTPVARRSQPQRQPRQYPDLDW